MAKYRKKPVVIEAFRFGHDLAPDWWREALNDNHAYTIQADAEAAIFTLEGKMSAAVGDWIIRGVNGELYPCKNDVFEKTYERVEEEAGV